MRIRSLAKWGGAASLGTALFTAVAQPAGVPSLAAGAYTEEQALRGRALYYEHCLQCHGETMAGVDKAPALAGPQFASTWTGAPLVALVARIETMPPEKPASLTRAQSVDLLTYLLWYNGLPLGSEPLPAEQALLSTLTFELPPAE